VTKRLIQSPRRPSGNASPGLGTPERLGPSATTSPIFKVLIKREGRSFDITPHCRRFEYSAMLNRGEMVRIRLSDMRFIEMNPLFGKQYFKYSKRYAPLEIESQVGWMNNDKLWIRKQQHALVSVTPHGESDNTAWIEFVGVDYPTYWLSAGDAGGGAYEGNVKEAIEQVVIDYGADVTLDFRGRTTDSKFNKWYQYRLPPMALIDSMLEWSCTVNEKETRWFKYPDGKKLIIQEQARVDSLHRSTYEYRGYGGGPYGQGDIQEWEMLGDNAIQMVGDKILSGGMSAVSGVYYDQVDYEQDVGVDDVGTPNKYNPSNTVKTSYARTTDSPQPEGTYGVGWSHVHPIPEHSAGDLGLKYDQYIDGRARRLYLGLNDLTMRCRFTVTGHYIWSGSEGLGADTINVIMLTDDNDQQFLHGNWIVYGFDHAADEDGWTTDLYCSKIDYDAFGKKVGKTNSQARR